MHPVAPGSAERKLRQLLERGHIGSITQVSVLDRRRTSEPAPGIDSDYVQLRTGGASALALLRYILGAKPVSVLARCATPPWSARHGTITNAFVEMERDIHVHYHGSLIGAGDEYVIRVDGDRGVLRSNRQYIAWRKRGWPVFVPIWMTIRPGARSETPEAGAPTEDARWSNALSEAVVRSDQSGQIVRMADLPNGSGQVRSAASGFR